MSVENLSGYFKISFKYRRWKTIGQIFCSVAANYIEANESLSKVITSELRFVERSKESKLWLSICDTGNNIELGEFRKTLIKEATELTRIFGSIVEKGKQNQLKLIRLSLNVSIPENS